MGILRNVAERIEGSNHIFVTDNYFLSLAAIQMLKEKGHFAVMVMRPRSARQDSDVRFKHPQYVLQESMSDRMEKGETKWLFHEDGMMMLGWQDSKNVFFLTNAVGNTYNRSPNGTITRLLSRSERTRLKDSRITREVPYPDVAQIYNESKSLVDKKNDLRQQIDVNFRFFKWTCRTVLNGVFATYLINAYRCLTGLLKVESYTFSEYVRKVAEQLINGFTSRKRPIVPCNPLPEAVMTHNEQPLCYLYNLRQPNHGPPSRIGKGKKQPLCVVCKSTPGGRGSNHCSFWCDECGAAFHKACFYRVHTS